MKNKSLVLEHENMLYHSKELVQLCIPSEVNLLFYAIIGIVITVISALCSVKINDVAKVSGIVRMQGNSSIVNNVIPFLLNNLYFFPQHTLEQL